MKVYILIHQPDEASDILGVYDHDPSLGDIQRALEQKGYKHKDRYDCHVKAHTVIKLRRRYENNHTQRFPNQGPDSAGFKIKDRQGDLRAGNYHEYPGDKQSSRAA